MGVLFVPRTKDGKLMRMLKDAEMQLEKMMRNRVKLVEKAGVPVRNTLWNRTHGEAVTAWTGELSCMLRRSEHEDLQKEKWLNVSIWF